MMFQLPKVIEAHNQALDALRKLHGIGQDSLTDAQWEVWDDACGTLAYAVRRLMKLESLMEEAT